MRFLAINILLIFSLSISGQFKLEPTYTYKKGNGCAIFGLDVLNCGCGCYHYDFEGQVRKIADAYDIDVFNAAQPTNEWVTCDLPDAAEAGYLDDFSQEDRIYIRVPDSSEQTITIQKDYDTTWIVPGSILFGLSNSVYTYMRIWDDGLGHLICNQPEVLSSESYVDYGQRVIHLKFLVAVNDFIIYGARRFYRKIKMMHYHDRPPGYYVFWMRNKQNGNLHKQGFVVTANTYIHVGKSDFGTYSNEIISIK